MPRGLLQVKIPSIDLREEFGFWRLAASATSPVLCRLGEGASVAGAFSVDSAGQPQERARLREGRDRLEGQGARWA